MSTRFIFIIFFFSLLTAKSFAQTDSTTSKLSIRLAMSYNPLLAMFESKQEIGPAISLGYSINKRFETGINWFSRQVIYAPDNAYKQLSNLKSTYNLESMYNAYLGYKRYKKRSTHMYSLVIGVRHDLYNESLVNPLYDINQSYRNSEWNMVYGLGYNYSYQITAKSALSLGIFVPVNRHPFDDAIKYSFEPGYVIKF